VGKTESKTRQAELLGISRQLFYYQHKKPPKDWELKTKIEEALREHPSYGHKRLAIHLQVNKKRVLRVMKLFGIKPYRKRSKKFRYIRANRDCEFPNLLLTNFPERPNQIWASDFTHIAFRGRWIYLATIIDLFNREIVGFSVLTCHSTPLIINALFSAVNNHPAPEMIHSDHGSEYASQDYSIVCQNLNIKQSMSQPGCPWENGYQESFYSQFKIDLGDPDRFNSLGELVYAIYKTIHSYNHSRIHTKLKMPPVLYSRQYQLIRGECV